MLPYASLEAASDINTMNNDMKRFVYMILSSAACMFAAGCSGTHDDDTGVQDSKLVLIPDKESIIADGKDAVTFSV